MHELERRVSAACDANSDRTADHLAELLDDLQHGIVAAAQYAASERDAAYDPARELDLHAANERMNNAQLLHGRSATQQPRLVRRFQQVQQQEEIAAYLAKRDELKLERDTLEQELTEVYTRAAGEIVALFQRVDQFKRRAQQQLGNPPPGVHGQAIDGVRVLDNCVLPDFAHPDRNVWPPPSTFAATFVESMGVPPHPGAAWCDPEIQQRQRAERETERTA